MSEFHHVSVLLHECIEALHIKENGIYVDGTLGVQDIPPTSYST